MAMYTYKPKMGDVVKFPNGVEINYDEANKSLVVLHPDPSKNLTVRPEMASGGSIDDDGGLILSKGIWLLGVK